MANYLERLKTVKRIVVKVGTSTLTQDGGQLNLSLMDQFVRQLAEFHSQGKEIAIVTSGAVGAGMGKLGLAEKPASIGERQALAAIGQGLLMREYEKLFSAQDKIVAQVLLTRDDLSDRRRYLNARNTIRTLLDYRAIPIINENDTVATEELKIGENDTLSALVAGLIEADLLVLLSDVDGLYSADPRKDPSAQIIRHVDHIDDEIRARAGGSGTLFGSGGMITKIEAAQMVLTAGSVMVLMNGNAPEKLQMIFSGNAPGTVFSGTDSEQALVSSRKRWIAYGPQASGTVIVDEGAERALVKQGKSLLPSGITALQGDFEAGDLVRILSMNKTEIGRGLSNYSNQELAKICGKKSGEIEAILGFKEADEAIHRDNLVLTNLA
jgi:glutamate 5-kinase